MSGQKRSRPTMDNNNDNDDEQQQDIFDRAHQAAHHMSLTWIRSVFREICYQLWKDHWRVDHVEEEEEEEENDEEGKEGENHNKAAAATAKTTHNSSSRVQIHLTAEMIQQAQNTCQRVANRWSHRLETQGHFEFANWIQQVVQQEGPTCFLGEGNTNNGNGNDTPSQTPQQLPTTTATEKEYDKTTTNQQNDDASESTANNETSHSQEDQNSAQQQQPKDPEPGLCVMTSLQSLSIPPDHMTDDSYYKYLIAQVDTMAYQQQTDWPYGWDVIQQATQRIPERMYSRDVSNVELQLVPKQASTTATTETENDDNDNDAQPQGVEKVDHPDMPPPPQQIRPTPTLQADDWTQQNIVERGRSRRNKRISYKEISSQMEEDDDATSSNLKQPSPPRLPTDMLTCQFSRQDVMAMGKAHPELDQCLHPEPTATTSDDTNSPTPNNTLLGALKPLGQVHHGLQAHHDGIHQFTLRGQKKYLGRSTLERYGPHHEEKSSNAKVTKGRWSKVARTTPIKETSREMYFMDLDLGECLLDLQEEQHQDTTTTSNDDNDANNGGAVASRRLYAFSSLELFLRDEDEPRGENNNNGNAVSVNQETGENQSNRGLTG